MADLLPQSFSTNLPTGGAKNQSEGALQSTFELKWFSVQILLNRHQEYRKPSGLNTNTLLLSLKRLFYIVFFIKVCNYFSFHTVICLLICPLFEQEKKIITHLKTLVKIHVKIITALQTDTSSIICLVVFTDRQRYFRFNNIRMDWWP